MINSWCDCCCSVAKLCPSLSPHGLQHTRLPWPSPSPGVCSNSCPLSQWCHHLLFCCPLFFLPSSFPSTSVFSNELALWMRWPNIGALASVLPMNIQGWFPLGLTGLISLWSKRLTRDFSNATIQNHSFFCAQPSLWSKSHISTLLLEKPYLRLYGSLLAKWYLCFLMYGLGLSQLFLEYLQIISLLP